MTRLRPFWFRRLLPPLVLLVALNLLGLAAWTLPQGYKQRNAESQLEAGRKELAEVRRSTEGLRTHAASIRANRADVGRFYAKHAGDEATELIPTLEAVEKMARAPGLKPGARGFARSEVEETSLERVRISLPLEGSYAQLVQFLREVETSSRFLTIDGVSMRADERRGGSLTVQLSAYLKAPTAKARKRGGRARG